MDGHLLDILKEAQTLQYIPNWIHCPFPYQPLIHIPCLSGTVWLSQKPRDHLLFFLWRVHPIYSHLLSPNSWASKISLLTSFPTDAALVQTANVSHLDDLESRQNAFNFGPSKPFVRFVAALARFLYFILDYILPQQIPQFPLQRTQSSVCSSPCSCLQPHPPHFPVSTLGSSHVAFVSFIYLTDPLAQPSRLLYSLYLSHLQLY